MKEVIVIGSGIAGMSAAVRCAEVTSVPVVVSVCAVV